MTAVSARSRAKKLAIHFGADASMKVEAMLSCQNLTGLASAHREVSAGSIGCLGDGALPAQGNLCFFTGVPINGPEIGDVVDAASAARLFPLWDGAFTAVFWDADREVLVVATDCLGMQPLYMRHADGELTLVSETKALNGEPDLSTWGAFIGIGHPIGERSLVKELRRVSAASVLTYDCKSGQLDISRYWDWPEPSDAWRDYDFLGALEQDVRGYAAYGAHSTLLLSGGFDSRLLLFLLERAGVTAKVLIVAHDDESDDADGRLAAVVARRAEITFDKVCPSMDFYSSPSYVDYLKASDVGFPSLDLFIARVAEHIDSPAVWDGLAPGFVFMPLHQPEGGFPAYLDGEIKGEDSTIWQAARRLFKPDVVAAMYDGFAQDLARETSRLSQDAHGLARFVIENRSRNRSAVNPLKVCANRADAYIPGLSKDFMTHAATIPFEEKRKGRFYHSLFAQLDKRALQVPFLTGGELMKGGRTDSAYYRQRLKALLAYYRARYPGLFRTGRRHAQRSAFLDERLLADEDAWLNPKIGDTLRNEPDKHYATWKLLFHWKAWRWLHEGRLDAMLGG